MKKYITIINLLLLFFIVGCTKVYEVALDKRSTSAMAADTKISASIKKGFLHDSDMKTLNISAYCYNENVYLVGEYDKAPQKEKAISIAKSVEGVRSVTTYILLKKKDDTCGTGDNLAIKEKVKAKLVADKDIWSTNVDIDVVQCNVLLLGIVKTGKEITKANAHARSVEGVRSVKSYLKSKH